ncbi:Na(+)/H(+) antiporter NhaA, partial [Enterobacter hormaechei]|nr:Na(+)/H(+) antiporter NhaA [Enterobacter hormaechei]
VPAYGPQNDVTLKMPAFEWVHVQLHQQKGMISLSPPTICNSAEKSTWLQVYGVSVLCGIGFTMSLFIGNLAFTGSPLLVDEVKVGVLAGSILAALAGILILRFAPSKQVR